MYTLTTKMKKNGPNGAFLSDGLRLTNGKFLIKHALVKDCGKWLYDAKNIESETLDRVYPARTDIVFHKTQYLYDHGDNLISRMFENAEGEYVGIAEDYVKAFKIEFVNGLDFQNAVMTHDEIVIMPVKLPEKFQ